MNTTIIYTAPKANPAIMILLALFLAYATYTDATRREIPNVTAGFTTAVALLAHYKSHELLPFLVAAIIFTAIYFLYALFITGSGGDMFLMMAVSACLGFYPTTIILAGSVIVNWLYLLARVIFKKQKEWSHEYPMAPFITISFCLFYFLGGFK